MSAIVVETSHDTCEPFDRNKIVATLEREVQLEKEESMKIARSIERQLKKLSATPITSSQIREMVNERLIKKGKIEEAQQHQRVGIPVAEIKQLIRGHNTDNANLQRNPETVHKFVADVAFKEYALLCLPDHLEEAHRKGDLHIHDLEYFPARPVNCLQHDMRWFIKGGLRVDGEGDHTSVAAPPKRLETFMNHAGEILLAGQQNMSGGQSFPLFNVFAAPFCKGLSYRKIRQKVQMFIFNLNMAYSNRGGQVPFTSINLEFGVPDFLKDEPAWGPEGKQYGTYKDWEGEVRELNRAFIDVLMEGDAMGKPHLFPNTIWVLRQDVIDGKYDEELLKVHELSAKYSIPYFANALPEWTGGHSDVMGCRTRLNTNWTGDWDMDTLRTGNLAYITINLPRIAYKSTNMNDFYSYLGEVLSEAEEILIIRRNHALKCLNEANMFPFLAQRNEDGEMYYRIDNTTLSFGFVGMDETLRAMGIKEGLKCTIGQEKAKEILQFFNQRKDELIKSTGLRWTILQTPGESTCHRFATLDKEHYPDKAIVNGEEGGYYYTNSSHVPVCESDMNLLDKMLIESQFHSLTAGGHIFHAWLGESHPDPKGLMSLTKKIAANSDIGFWAYTSAFSFCFGCNHFMRGLQENCTQCGCEDEVEYYSRITGYIQQVGHKKNSGGGWNAGKRSELKDRFEHEVT